MKRACIFAHYDKHGLIDDYVLFYLQSLVKVVDRIVFVTDCVLKEGESKRLFGLASDIISENHGEYDFGSYKRGYLLLKADLQYYDELVFCNDSCYGPFSSFEGIFNFMNDKNVDFWGLTANFFGLEKSKLIFSKCYKLSKEDYHLQSYFIVFKKNVFGSDAFLKFINSIQQLKRKEEIIVKYEVGLTKCLMNAGFNCDSFIPFFKDISNITIIRWREIMLFKNPFPFVKIGLLKNLFKEDFVFGWEEFLLKNFKYDIQLIKKHLNRINTK